MDMKEIGEMCLSHTPTKEELQEIYKETKDLYNEAVSNSIEKAFSNESATASYREKPTPGPIAKEFIAKLNQQKFENTITSKDDNGFMKNDSGKNMLSLIDPAFVLLLGEILSFGARKYAPNNWQLCEDTSRYKDALLRHIYAYLSGETVDPESGLSHLGHAAFGLMCLNYFDNKEQN